MTPGIPSHTLRTVCAPFRTSRTTSNRTVSTVSSYTFDTYHISWSSSSSICPTFLVLPSCHPLMPSPISSASMFAIAVACATQLLVLPHLSQSSPTARLSTYSTPLLPLRGESPDSFHLTSASSVLPVSELAATALALNSTHQLIATLLPQALLLTHLSFPDPRPIA